MPSSRKRASREMSDSDDSDDDLLESVFGGSRSSKRSIAKDEADRKRKRMAQMNALVDNGKVKLERENRMDKLCLKSNNLIRDDGLDEEKNDKTTNDDGSGNDATSAKASGTSPSQRYEPKDSKETSCLGSRITLQFSREITVRRTADQTCSPRVNEKDSCGFTPFWSGLEEALTDLRTILMADQQTQQRPSSFATLREELLRLCTTNSPHACRTYLRKSLMSKKKDRDEVRRIHVNVLRWLMALACGPVTYGDRDGSGCNNQNRTANKQKKQKQSTTGSNSHVVSRKLLMEAQTGAYQTLYRLWSQDLGFPLQDRERGDIYVLSIRALARQLRYWFGSSFSFETESGNSGKCDKTGEAKIDTVQVTNSHTTLIRFLQLWALALQKQNHNDDIEDHVHFVQFHYDVNRVAFGNDASEAIIAVLWAGLNPSFASSISAKNDGNRSIQTIVGSLLHRVRRENTSYKNNHDDGENAESFRKWMESLCERIVSTWSIKLGRGRKGTDAYEDEYAWLSLARSVTRLVTVDGGDYQKVGCSRGGLKGCDHKKSNIVSSLKDFQLSLCRCIIIRAFVAEQDGQKVQNVESSLAGKRINNDGKSNDWISPFIDEEIRRMNVPVEIRSSHRWKAMALAVAGMVKLAGSFPEDRASKCFALMDICTVCFQSAILELEPEIQKHCPKEKNDDFDEDEDTLITNDRSVAIASSSVKDEVFEMHALYNALVRLETASKIISERIRTLMMRNVCFPWASQMAESLRMYVDSQRGRYAPPSAMNNAMSVKHQSMIKIFFKNKKNEQGINHQSKILASP